MFPKKISDRIRLLRWMVPSGILVLFLIYQFGVARLIHHAFGEKFHYLAEVLFFGTVGPLLAYLLLDYVARWLEEKETSELQAQVLAEVREQVEVSRKLNDDALQTLYATSVYLNTLTSSVPDLPIDLVTKMEETELGLERAMQGLREQLQYQSGNNKVKSGESLSGETIIARRAR